MDRDSTAGEPGRPLRLRVEVRGAVQGVGFRPFVYRLANALGLHGWVINDTRGVFIEVEGGRDAQNRFLERLLIVSPDTADDVLTAVRTHPLGKEAAIIGQVVADHPGKVFLKSRIGGQLVVDMLSGEQLPRIC